VNNDKKEPAATPRSRVVRIRIDQERYDQLERSAEDASVTPDQLAGVWLRDRIDQVMAAAVASRTASEMELVLRLLSSMPVAAELSASGGPGEARRGRKGSLHDEIVEVLRERGGSMTAAEIAREIRLRGAYRAPRSGQPITGTAVSRRVANPYYKSLFEREGRRLSLAGQVRKRQG